MSSACRKGLLALALLLGATGAEARELRVCADPNNMPFSNDRREGFENRVVDIIARDLRAEVTYVWWAQRRGFFRDTLNAGLCDLVAGVPAGFELTLNTKPWYRSSYAVVSRPDGPSAASFDDPALWDLSIGVQLAGDDGANPPPIHALAARGITGHLHAYLITADYRQQDPPARVVDAVASGEADIAFVWGPLAGWSAARQSPPLTVRLLPDDGDRQMAFSIAMGVRRGNTELRDEVQAAIDRNRPSIDAILAEMHIPVLPIPPRPEGGER